MRMGQKNGGRTQREKCISSNGKIKSFMTKSEIFLYRQNILNDLKPFSPAHPEASRWLPIYETDC